MIPAIANLPNFDIAAAITVIYKLYLANWLPFSLTEIPNKGNISKTVQESDYDIRSLRGSPIGSHRLTPLLTKNE